MTREMETMRAALVQLRILNWDYDYDLAGRDFVIAKPKFSCAFGSTAATGANFIQTLSH